VTSPARPAAGLDPARPARPIRAGERIHVVGVAGAGASAAALHAAWAGARADGCDPGGPSPYTAALAAEDIPIAWAHDPAHVTGTTAPGRLAVTKALTAIAPDHPELVAARRAGIPVEPWQQVIADAAAGRTLVGIAGTHGKSTTAGWLVHVLVSAGLDPAAFVGALLPSSLTGGLPATARRGRGAAFVVEADEYAGNYVAYHPATTVVTNLEWDHPDVFADRDAVIAAVEAWLRGAADGAAAEGPVLHANVGDHGAAELARRLAPDWPGTVSVTALVEAEARRAATIARGLADEYAGPEGPAGVLLGRIVATTPDATTLELSSTASLGDRVAPLAVQLPLVGRHNAANALGVAAAALGLGVASDRLASGLASFAGVGRRLERKGEAGGVVVFDDYGHHPTAIRETLAAVRQRAPGRRVWAVYEPLTYHRTAALLDDFAAVLATADAVAVADIWAGRDPDTTITSAAALAEAVAGRNPRIPVAAPGSVEATARWLAAEVRPGDAVLVMGGGRSYRIGEELLELLADR
jgi:UDP-N-acetylmuramate--alanine ligase